MILPSTVRRLRAVLPSVAGLLLLVGCTTRPAFLPNPDPSLKKPNAEFKADAADRHYEASAPRAGDADGAVEIDYAVRRLSLIDSSATDWDNVELWVNHQYVILVPHVQANAARAELLNFNSIFDTQGNALPADATASPIRSVELFMGGKMYHLNTQLAD